MDIVNYILEVGELGIETESKRRKNMNDKCWFCGKGNCDEFDTEFDTFLHRQCLIDVLDKDPNHPEAELMKYLLED